MSQRQIELKDLPSIAPVAFKSFIKRLAVDYERPFYVDDEGNITTEVGDEHKITLIWDEDLKMWQPYLPKSSKKLALH
jgi:hypothetical protein